MKISKAIKRIVALGTGVTMVGATILGAMAAADLSAYPKPFVDNGKFNALIVVGANAKTEDVLGSIDIATSLQYSTTVTKAVPGASSSASVEGEGFKIETENNKLTIGEDFDDVKSKITSAELPNLLAGGTYVNDGDTKSEQFGYTQDLAFGTGKNASVTFLRDADFTDGENPYVMIFSPRSTGSGEGKGYFMKYTLDFTKLASSRHYGDTTCGSANELCDFEGSKISMLGIDYEVTKAEWDGTNTVTWEMMGGTSLNTMYEGETKTFTINGEDYEVTVDIISDSGSTVVLTVNGQSTKELARDQTDTVSGIEIGIKKLMSNEAGEAGAGKDLVQFYLGASKVVLTDSDTTATMDSNLQLGTETVDEVFVDWTVVDGTDNLKLDALTLYWAPEEELMLGAGDSAAMPGFGSFRVEFGGMSDSGKTETISLKPQGDDKVRLTAPLQSGDTTVDVLFTDGTSFTSYGKSATSGSGKMFLGTGTMKRGDYLVLSSSTEEETHVVELDTISTANLTKIKDLGDGVKYEATCTSTCTINVGNVKAVFSSVDNAAGSAVIHANSDDSNLIYTKEGLTLNLGAVAINGSLATHGFVVTEESSTGTLTGGAEFEITAGLTSSKTTISAVADGDSDAFEIATGQSATNWEMADTEVYKYQTKFGTVIEWDKSGTQDFVTITYPGEQANAAVFVNSETATVVSGSSGDTYEEVQKIEVGSAILDSEAPALGTQNMIVVGGPCVNSVAAELMENPADCAAGFEDGKAMIKLFENDGKVAMLVAGYSAMDTRRASRVVAKFDTYSNFQGTELEVTGTSLSDIKVGAPVAETE